MLVYIIQTIVLLAGISIFFLGKQKKNDKLKGIGIGVLLAFVILGIPSFIEGAKEGFQNGIHDDINIGL